MTPNWKAAFLVSLIAATTVAAAAENTLDTTSDAMPVNLTGVWNLDEHASDDLAGQLEAWRKQMTARRGGGRGTGGEHGGGRGGGGGRGSGMGGHGGMGGQKGESPSGDHEQDDGGHSRDLAQAMEQLLITVDGAVVEIMDGTDRTHRWAPGAGAVKRDGPEGEMVEKAWWDETVLVLSTNGGHMSVTRRLHLEDEGGILVADVSVTTSESSEGIDARLVYSGY